ncbi:hypothetical protein BC834DRAFT_969859 [Gloeopeniophorella convolvens]|nr:hypothetical protein BC834DRAFT_969859 [Gloeopeniophorella convolvens]
MDVLHALNNLRPSERAKHGDQILQEASALLEMHKDVLMEHDQYDMFEGRLTIAKEARYGLEDSKNVFKRSHQSKYYHEMAQEILQLIKQSTLDAIHDEDGLHPEAQSSPADASPRELREAADHDGVSVPQISVSPCASTTNQRTSSASAGTTALRVSLHLNAPPTPPSSVPPSPEHQTTVNGSPLLLNVTLRPELTVLYQHAELPIERPQPLTMSTSLLTPPLTPATPLKPSPTMARLASQNSTRALVS